MRGIHLRVPAAFSALSLLLALLSEPASAQTCVSSLATNIVAGTLTLHGSDPGLASAVQAAAGVWVTVPRQVCPRSLSAQEEAWTIL
jgi:hypothetical protein